MRDTRSSKLAAADTPKETSTSRSKYALSSKSGQPSKLFILPRSATADARIVSLPHPQNGRPSRYLACPETGLYEFTKVAVPKKAPRSWLIASSSSEKEKHGIIQSAEAASSADLFVATAVDPLFLLLPALMDAKATKPSTDQKRLFLSIEDYLHKLPEDLSNLSEVAQWPKTKALLESRLAAVCDSVDAGDETMFRVNEEKLFSVILSKATRFASGGLPISVEEKFVQKALEAPILLRSASNLAGSAAAVATALEDAESGTSTPKTESAESQFSTATEGSTFSAISQPSTAASSFSEEDVAVTTAMTASTEVIQLQRLRVAFDFICASCIPQVIGDRLKASLADKTTCKVDFEPLYTYVTDLDKLRKEAMATRPTTDFSKKRMRDEEEDEARLEKKRKAEEDKKRKANESRGVRDLKKVNTTGMKKLSAFFTKK
ncbi:Ribonuclease H2, subunit B [Cordyceps fumosorosea ARSEF 2679]|uniref:Ribonuclease H2 subunit B n=1 Tax=Cordyceps fumosorosea (strain ARSEF 2679) TaxID=1081104 RepID=A0A167WJ05_CORFA|nr:Ribonuclease H2, subunit B [Cordyceps fumosorosea ARSEF 2679]OAA63849.1 Ribonuclease H2, subunit B [Cordyceps fumosorosea ARSEF 2679]